MPTPDQADRILTLACVDMVNEQRRQRAVQRRRATAACRHRLLRRAGACVGGIVAGGRRERAADARQRGRVHSCPAGDLPAVFGGTSRVRREPPRRARRSATRSRSTRPAQPLARTTLGHRVRRPAVPGAPTRATTGSTAPLGAARSAAGCGDGGDGGQRAAARRRPGRRRCAWRWGRSARELPVGAGRLRRPRTAAPRRWRRRRPEPRRRRGDAALDRGRPSPSHRRRRRLHGSLGGKVRFLAAPVPAGRKVTRVIVRNAAGAVIGIGEDHGASVTRSARLADGLELVRNVDGPAVRDRDASRHRRVYCTDPNPGTQIDGPYLPYSGAVVVHLRAAPGDRLRALPGQAGVPTPRRSRSSGSSCPATTPGTRRSRMPRVTELRAGKNRVAAQAAAGQRASAATTSPARSRAPS